MIEKITIQNFRCFQKTEVSNLSRINILVGRNGSGKTAMLEALFVGSGNPELLFRIRAQRLGESTAIVAGNDSVLPFVRQLYFNCDTKFPISIKTFGAGVNRLAQLTAQAQTLKYEFHPRVLGKKFQTFNIRWGDDGKFKITPPPSTEVKTSFFAASVKHSPQEASMRFSDLSKKNESAEFVSALKFVLPRLENLSIELETGIPMIFAKMEGVSESLPMQFVSDGISRLLSILVGITNSQGGYILIDELENGIYHQAFKDIVNVIQKFAETYNVQVFITTHSKELLEAVAAVVEGNEDNYALLRFERGEIEQFSGHSFRSAITQHIEIR
jgi:AAA15 family ATPase/GTPase